MEKFLPLINRENCCKIWLKDIIYLENESRMVHIVTTKGCYHEYAKLSDLLQYFSGEPCFFSAMKRLIVNFDHVSSMKNQVICFSDGTEYPLGRVNYLKTKQTFVNYMLNSREGIVLQRNPQRQTLKKPAES